MVTVTVTCYESKWSDRAMTKCKPPIFTRTETLESEPEDYSQLGVPVTDWLLLSDTAKERQFCHRNRVQRIDHCFIVRIERSA